MLPAGCPEIPRPLTKIALAEWNRVAPLLLKLGTLTDADGDALATYCETIERYKKCQAQLDREGMTVATTQGTSAHPLPGDIFTTAQVFAELKDSGATLRTVQRWLRKAEEHGYLREQKKRSTWRLGIKTLPQ